MGKLREGCGYRDDNRQKDEQVDATGARFVNVTSSLATLTSPGLSLVFISMRWAHQCEHLFGLTINSQP